MEFTTAQREGVYKAIHDRRDVRGKFDSRPIPNEVVTRILEAAHHAPSVGFSQPWDFILIRGMDTRLRIRDSFEAERQRSASRLTGERRLKYESLKLEGILESYMNICVTYDPDRFGPFVIGKDSMPDTGVYSVCCAIQNLWLAARAEGVGVGWVSILSGEIIRECLGLPDRVLPVAYLCMGYVDVFSTKPDLEEAGWLPRLKLHDVVSYERWRGDARTDDVIGLNY